MCPMTITLLGRQPHLGYAELEAVYGAAAVRILDTHIVAVDAAWEDVAARPLGSVMKSAEVVAEVPTDSWPALSRALLKQTRAMAAAGDGKVTFGISVIGARVTIRDIEKTGLTMKRELKKSGRPVRYVQNKEPELSSATVLHNKLTRQATGYEWLIISLKGRSLIARTRYVQDIDAYSARDFGRPKRDAFVGMLPPKLAQIMINLAATPVTTGNPRLLDPFCGTGVVLQEAALMGYAVYGTDLSRKMVDYSRDNLLWLEDTHRVQPDKYFEVADAQTHTWRPPLNLVVCEGYLGTPFSSVPTDEKLRATIHECNGIMKQFLANIAPQLSGGTSLVVGMPAWFVRGTIHHLPLLDDLKDFGYNRIDFEHARADELIYHREDQVVGRELVVLRKE